MWDLGAKLWASTPAAEQDDASVSYSPDVCNRGEEKGLPIENSSSQPDENSEVDKDIQDGVREVEAVTLVWDTKSLILVFFFIYAIYTVDSMHSTMSSAFTAYVTSDFSLHSLTATTGILSNILGGLSRLPLSKIIDVWGRREGFAVMGVFLTIGLVMMAACNNVETYAAAQVFYWIGYTGIQYIVAVMIADATSLRNRGIVYGIVSTPYLFTTFAAGPAATNYINGPGWRWGFGTFAIVTPVMCLPVLLIFTLNKRKAKKLGTYKARPNSDRTIFQSLKHYAIELDVLGLLLICGGLALFLLPFSLYSYQAKQWRSPMIICMLVFGIIILILFGVYEKFFAPKSFLPIAMLSNRTVLGSSIYGALAFVSFYIWNSFFYSFLIVVNDLSISKAVLIRNIYTLGSCSWALIVGLLIRFSGRYKWLALYFGVPLSVLGVGLMVAFRQPDVNIGFIVMCQIFIALGGGTTVICQQVAVMAAVSHQEVAVALAIQYAFTSIGGAIGSSIAAAIWTGVYPARLQAYLPAESQANFTQIYGSIVVQSSYEMGSPTRNAIARSYGEAQRYMLIAATSFLAVGIFAVMIWHDINVKQKKQTKGHVF
ncbi:major facilitator superfamily transporter [Aureobasidium pullulans]|nr:major facilitator superfamily transporter [Aureobasidium pullulans]